jgi:hypothetical protein
MYKSGDSVEFIGKFYDDNDALADPTSVTITIYNHSTRTQLATASATKVSVGVYRYYYTLPTDLTGAVVYEFVGQLDGRPTVIRELIPIEWV